LRNYAVLNGTPKAVLENEELMQLLIHSGQILQSLKLIYQTEPALECPITTFGGLLRDVKISQSTWKRGETRQILPSRCKCFLATISFCTQPAS